MEVETLEDGADGTRSATFIYYQWTLSYDSDKLTAKAQKITIKLPWEILTIYSEVLPEDDEEDEDDIEAHEASALRLKVTLFQLFQLQILTWHRKQTM